MPPTPPVIRPVDVHDTAAFHAFHAVAGASRRFERAMAGYWSEHEAATALRNPEDSERLEAHAAYDGDRVVGTALVILPLLDNRDLLMCAVDVHPDERRRGVGSALTGYVVELARAAGRSKVLAASHYPADRAADHPYRRFAEKNGFALANTEVHRVLDLPVPAGRLREWAEEAAAHHGGYQIRTYVDSIPEHLLPSYAYLVNQLVVDAPTGDLELEAEAVTPEVLRQQEAVTKQQGRTVYATVAVGTGADGSEEAVAHSVIGVPPEGTDLPNAYQWATLVRGDHRGHRLGLAVKAANLAAVQGAHPERRLVHTSNSEQNGPMVAINERFGFRPVELNAEFLRTL